MPGSEGDAAGAAHSKRRKTEAADEPWRAAARDAAALADFAPSPRMASAARWAPGAPAVAAPQLRPLPPAASAAPQHVAAAALGRSFSKRVYVGSLHYALTASDLRTAFAPFGEIQGLEMPDDPVSGHHKGFAFIEFSDEAAAALALATMDGFPLAGRRIKVSRPQSLGVTTLSGVPGGAPPPPPPSKAGSVAAAAAAAAAAAMAAGRMPAASPAAPWLPQQPQFWEQHGTPPTSPVTPAQGRPSAAVFLAGWHPALSEADLRSVASAFGPLATVQLLPPVAAALAHAVTCALVQFERAADAEVAVRNLDGLAMAGHVIKAGFAPTVPVNAPPASRAALLADASAAFARRACVPPAAAGRRSSAPLALPAAAEAASRHSAQLAAAQQYAAQLFAGQHAAASPPQQRPASPPSPVVVLDNLAEPHELDASLEAEVREECARHGAVVRVQMAVVPSPPPAQRCARVFVVFSGAAAAASAAAALDGRLFAGRRVRCQRYDAARFAAGDWEAER